jgi:hypothetical protein
MKQPGRPCSILRWSRGNRYPVAAAAQRGLRQRQKEEQTTFIVTADASVEKTADLDIVTGAGNNRFIVFNNPRLAFGRAVFVYP